MLAVLGASDGEALKINLTLFRQMEFTIKLHTRKAGGSIVYTDGSKVIISKNFLSPMIDFVCANSVDPDEMLHFIWVVAVCQSTHLRFKSLHRVV